MRDFHPFTRILALIALAMYCLIPSMRFIHFLGILFLLIAIDFVFYAVFSVDDDT